MHALVRPEENTEVAWELADIMTSLAATTPTTTTKTKVARPAEAGATATGVVSLTDLPHDLLLLILGRCRARELVAASTTSKDTLALLDEPVAWTVAIEDVDPFFQLGPALVLVAARHHRGGWRGLMSDLGQRGGCWLVHPPDDAPLDSMAAPRYSLRAAAREHGASPGSPLPLVRGTMSDASSPPMLHLNHMCFRGGPSIEVSTAVELLAATRTRGIVNILITRSIDCGSICVAPVRMRQGEDTFPLVLPWWCSPRLVGVPDPTTGRLPELIIPRGGIVIESDVSCFESLRIVSGSGDDDDDDEVDDVCECCGCRHDPACYPALDIDACASVLIDGVEVVSRVGTAIMNSGSLHVADTQLRYQSVGLVNSTGAQSTLRGCSLSGGMWGVAGGIIGEHARAALLDANTFDHNIEHEAISDMYVGYAGTKYQLWQKGWCF